MTNPVSGAQTTTAVTFATAAQEYGKIGATFGSSLGRILAGSNAFAQIGAGTVLGALGQEVGGLIAAETTNGLDVEKAIDGLVSTDTILSSVEGQGVGAVSAYLIGELFKDIGITGAPAQVVQSLAGQAVSQIAINLINGVDWASNLDDLNISNIAGAYVGTQLGNLVYSASTVQGQEGASVGSAVGGVIGSIVIEVPFVGSAIGSFIGDIIGGLIGDQFGQSHISHISGASFLPVTSGAPLTFSYTTWTYQNGPDATSIGEAISGSLNAILAAAGGAVSNAASLTPFGIGVNDETTTSGAGPVLYYYDDYSTSPTLRTQYDGSSTTLTQVLDYAETRELSEMVFSGADPYIVRAIDAALRSSPTPDMQTVSGDLQIAKDYETYEANKTVINALIAANPNSDFAAGWIAELAIAASMGFGTSIQGGAQDDVLGVANGDKILIGGGGNDTYVVNQGDGAVTIDNGVSYNNTANGSLDLTASGLYFTANSDYTQPGQTNLTFSVQGADLIVSDGVGDSATLKGWFAGSFAELNQVSLSNGTIINLYNLQLEVDQQTTTQIGDGIYVDHTTTNIGIEGQNNFTNSSNAITGGNGEDVLAGGAGANDFLAGGGNDIAYGGGGTDEYQLDAPGQLTIYNNETATGAVVGSGVSGSLVFGAGLGGTASQLSFSDSGDQIFITGLSRRRERRTGFTRHYGRFVKRGKLRRSELLKHVVRIGVRNGRY